MAVNLIEGTVKSASDYLIETVVGVLFDRQLSDVSDKRVLFARRPAMPLNDFHLHSLSKEEQEN